MVGHCAVRHYAMGERSLDETPATDDDIAAMCDLVDEAMGAGALGFSTSRTLLHRVPDGRPVPGTWADERELLAIADVLGRRGHGVYEVAPRFERPGARLRGTRAEVHWMAEINRRTGRPVTFGLAQSNAGPELYRKILELVDEEGDARRRAAAADHRRGIGLLFGLQHRTFFDRAPAWAALQERCRSTRGSSRVRDPARRGRAPRGGRRRQHTPARLARRVRARPATHVDYSADPATSLAAARGTARRDDRRRRSCGSRSRPTGGRCSTIPSSTSGWTRSRSSSTIPGWRSASATPARTSG